MCTGTHGFIPAENTASLELIMTLSGQRVENALHVQYPGSITESYVRLLAEGAIAAWLVELAPQMSEDVQLVLVRTKDLSSEDSFGFEVAPSTIYTGLLNQASLPGNVTVSTKFASGRTGRSYRGRAYWVGLSELQVTGNELADGVAEAISDAWESFFDAILATDGSPIHVVVSYCHDGSWRTTAQVTPVTNYTTDGNVDSMRRRLNGRGQ